MTDEEKQEYKREMVEQIKKYCRIDYDDDDDIVELMVGAVIEKLADLVPQYDPYHMTNRQKLLLMMYVKDHYDHDAVYQDGGKQLSSAAASMLLSEIYKGESA